MCTFVKNQQIYEIEDKDCNQEFIWVYSDLLLELLFDADDTA